VIKETKETIQTAAERVTKTKKAMVT